MMNWERFSARTSSLRWDAEKSAWFSSISFWHPLFDAGVSSAAVAAGFLVTSVELDDELLGERHVDLGSLGSWCTEHPLTFADDLQPGRDRAVTRGLPGDLERHGVQRVVANVDDVVLGHPVAPGC